MKNWKKVKLGTLLTESKVVSEKPSTDKRLRVKLNVLGVMKRPITKDKKGATKYYTRKAGQFVYGKQNLHKGAFGIVPKELDGFESSLDIPAFDIDVSCYPEWIFYFFKKGDFYLKLETLAKGVGSKRIHPKQIFELDIYLPSKEEQRKVLDEIEKAEINNQELVKEIIYQEENLSKLRQSILQDAVQGKLTKEWRAENPTTEPASELLKKIKAEKEQLIEEKRIRKEKPLSPITKNEIQFEIPESWEWCYLGETMLKVTDGTHHSPKNGQNGDYKYVSAKNIKNDGIMLSNITYVSKEDHKEIYARCNPELGDILYIKDGATTGICCINNLDEEFSMLSSVALLKQPNEVLGIYLLSVLRSPYYYELMRMGMSGVAITRVTLKKLKESTIPIPPLEEQKVIVGKANQLLANCDVLEQEIMTSKTNAEKLIQSVLGELLGEENNVLVNKTTSKKGMKKPSREIKYNSKTLLMDLVKLLKENSKLHAEDLWKMSKYPNDIDAFYAELKKQIEEEKAIKEVANEKGYLELA